MLKKVLILIYRFYYILWHDLPTNPTRIYIKSFARFKRGGLKELISKLNQEYHALKPYQRNRKSFKYARWIKQNEQNNYDKIDLNYTPLISIITPTYNTEPYFLEEMIKSVLSQTYKNWELCIADDASDLEKTKNSLLQYENSYKNIKIIYRENNGHISEASNSALTLATGEYVTFLDHDDMLAPNALYEMVKKLNEDRRLKFIYSDEDKIDFKGKRYDPHFKSGWNPDMFYSQNYLAHLTLIRTELIRNVGGFRKGLEGSQDYDLYLRVLKCIEVYEIAHIEKILYHWRAIPGSTALDAKQKNYTSKIGLKALNDYFSNQNKSIKVTKGLLPNTYKVSYPIPKEQPLVSLLIPTRDGYDILSKCIGSILSKTTYTNYEIIILDNETSDQLTLEYFNELKKRENISIIEYNHPFNYSAINNCGVKHAKGEIIGLINNDVEVISEHWLTEMVQHAIRPEVGAVGAKLYYENNTIQHAGVILGIGGVAGHSHKYFPKDAHGYFGRLKIIQSCSAVTGACLIVRKSLYEEVDGLEEKYLTVAFNDVDFCLKLQEKGYRNLWTPYVELYHYESISRGAEDDEVKIARFNKEIHYMKNKWGSMLEADIYYNANLTLEHENFEIKK